MSWSVLVPLHSLARGPVRMRLEPGDAERAAAAEQLALAGLPELSAEVEVSPWLDGCEVRGRWRARVTQTCGVTLDPFDAALGGDFTVRAVPAGSPNAPSEAPEVELDIDSDDPPDILPGAEVDVAAYVIEHLALELDPFPRKPDAVFEAPEAEPEASPFAVLGRLRPQ
jgi:hypothetical protein